MEVRVYVVGAHNCGKRTLVDSLRSMLRGNDDLFHTLNGSTAIEQRVLSELPPSPENSSSSGGSSDADDDIDGESTLQQQLLLDSTNTQLREQLEEELKKQAQDREAAKRQKEGEEQQRKQQEQQQKASATGDSVITVDPLYGEREAAYCPTISSKTRHTAAFLQTHLRPRDVVSVHSFIPAAPHQSLSSSALHGSAHSGGTTVPNFIVEDFHMSLVHGDASSSPHHQQHEKLRHQQQQQAQKSQPQLQNQNQNHFTGSRVESVPRDETTVIVTSSTASSSTVTVRRCHCDMLIPVPPQLLLHVSELIPRGTTLPASLNRPQPRPRAGPPPQRSVSLCFNEAHLFSHNCLCPPPEMLQDAHIVLVVADAPRWIVQTAVMAARESRGRGIPLGPALFEECMRQTFLIMTSTSAASSAAFEHHHHHHHKSAAARNFARRCVLVLSKWDICLAAASQWKKQQAEQQQQQQQQQHAPHHSMLNRNPSTPATATTTTTTTLFSSSDREEAVDLALFLEVASFFSHAVPTVFLMSVVGSQAQFSDFAICSSKTGSNIRMLADSLRTWASETAVQLDEDSYRRRAAAVLLSSSPASSSSPPGAAAAADLAAGDDKKCLIA